MKKNNDSNTAVLEPQTLGDGRGDKPPTVQVVTAASEPSGSAPEAPAMVEVKPRIPAIAPEFWKAYNTPGGIEALQGYRPRSVITLGRMTDLAEALGRSLTVEDFTKLVMTDGDARKCDLCGAHFQPIKWVVMTRNFLAQAKEEGLDAALEGEKLVWGGNFMNIGFTIRCVCTGTGAGPYYYGQKPGNGGEFAVMNNQTCLGKAHGSEQNVNPRTKKPNPVRDHAGAIRVQDILKGNLRAKVEEKQRDEASLGQFFGGAHDDTIRAVKSA